MFTSFFFNHTNIALKLYYINKKSDVFENLSYFIKIDKILIIKNSFDLLNNRIKHLLLDKKKIH